VAGSTCFGSELLSEYTLNEAPDDQRSTSPLSLTALGETITTPAWKTLPSWYLVAKNDQALPPDAERFFAQRMGATTVEIDSSHVAMVSHPDAVAKLIKNAARAVSAGH